MSIPDEVQINEERIAWVLGHPRMSSSLKEALKDVRERDPVEVLNEMEILNLLLRTECERKPGIAYPGSMSGKDRRTIH